MAQPGEIGASYPSPLCCCLAGTFAACLLKGAVWVAVLAWHTCMLWTHLCSELVGHRGLWREEMRSVLSRVKI